MKKFVVLGNLIPILLIFCLVNLVASDISPIVSISQNENVKCKGVLLSKTLVMATQICNLVDEVDINIGVDENVKLSVKGTKIDENIEIFEFFKIKDVIPYEVSKIHLTEEIIYPKKLPQIICGNETATCNMSCSLHEDHYFCKCIDRCPNVLNLDNPLIFNSTLYGLLYFQRSNLTEKSVSLFYKSLADSYQDVINLYNETTEQQTEPTPVSSTTQASTVPCHYPCEKVEWQFILFFGEPKYLRPVFHEEYSLEEKQQLSESCKPKVCNYNGQKILPPVKRNSILPSYTAATCEMFPCKKINWQLVIDKTDRSTVKGIRPKFSGSEQYTDEEKNRFINFCKPMYCTYNGKKVIIN